MTKSYNYTDYQLDRVSSKCHHVVMKKINDDKKGNKINFDEHLMKG